VEEETMHTSITKSRLMKYEIILKIQRI
jgi:hypothetical protein